jgi:RecA/RadA recombinase
MRVDELRKSMKQRWPEVSLSARGVEEIVFSTGIDSLDSLFSTNGIPFGQLVQISGGVSSGKTSFLFKMLAALTKQHFVAYIDFSGSFFPSAADMSGVDISKIIVVEPDDIREGLRAAELILRQKIACCVVLDLVAVERNLPQIMMHRLRRQIIGAGSILILLTDDRSTSIPASMVSIELRISRNEHSRFGITVTKSRIGNLGGKVEFVLNE